MRRLIHAMFAMVVMAGVGTSFLALSSPWAFADTGGYPWASAPCQFGSAGGASCINPNNSGDRYDWWWDENGNGVLNSPGELYDQWGYEYRNCTSYVAWKLSVNGYSPPFDIGNANAWDN